MISSRVDWSTTCLGAEPNPGVFVIGYNEDPIPRRYMTYHKMGDGPLYVFYTPYHLCNFEVPLTAARAVLFRDAAIAPLAGPVCEVMTVAKRDICASGRRWTASAASPVMACWRTVTRSRRATTYRWAFRRAVAQSEISGRMSRSRIAMWRSRPDD